MADMPFLRRLPGRAWPPKPGSEVTTPPRTSCARRQPYVAVWDGPGLQNRAARFDSSAACHARCRRRSCAPGGLERCARRFLGGVRPIHCSDLGRGRAAHDRADEGSSPSAATSFLAQTSSNGRTPFDRPSLTRPVAGRRWMVTGYHPGDAGSSPAVCPAPLPSLFRFADVAQPGRARTPSVNPLPSREGRRWMVIIGNDEVAGSNPAVCSSSLPVLSDSFRRRSSTG